MIEFLKTLNEEDNYELIERLNFELYPNKGNKGHEFFKSDGFLHIVTWDHTSDCINNNIDNSLVLHDYGILVGDPDKTKLDPYFTYMLEKFGESWFSSTTEYYKDNHPKAEKTLALLNRIKEEFDNQAAPENIEYQESTTTQHQSYDFSPCDGDDMGL